MRVFTGHELRALPAHTQFLLVNSHPPGGRLLRHLQRREAARPARRGGRGPGRAGVHRRDDRRPRRLPASTSARGRSTPPSRRRVLSADSTLPASAALAASSTIRDRCRRACASGAPIPGEPWLLLGLRAGWRRDGHGQARRHHGQARRRRARSAWSFPRRSRARPIAAPGYLADRCGDGYDFDQTKDHNAGAMVARRGGHPRQPASRPATRTSTTATAAGRSWPIRPWRSTATAW